MDNKGLTRFGFRAAAEPRQQYPPVKVPPSRANQRPIPPLASQFQYGGLPANDLLLHRLSEGLPKLAYNVPPPDQQNQQNRGAGGGGGANPRRPSPVPPVVNTTIGPVGKSAGPVPPLNNRNYQEARYKTELCLHFREKNFCPHGARCLFAHGLNELRPYRGRHPKHKTQKCKSFHENGYCNYGYRCSYIHLESPQTIRYINGLNEAAQASRKISKKAQIQQQHQRRSGSAGSFFFNK